MKLLRDGCGIVAATFLIVIFGALAMVIFGGIFGALTDVDWGNFL